MTKDQAIEIRNKVLAECPMDAPPEYSRGYDSGALALLDALANAGAFADGAPCVTCNGSGMVDRFDDEGLDECESCLGTGHADQPSRPVATEVGATCICASGIGGDSGPSPNCTRCHGTGIAGAPRRRDMMMAPAWQSDDERNEVETEEPSPVAACSKARAQGIVDLLFGDRRTLPEWAAGNRVVEALERDGFFHDPAPVLACSKARAEEILSEAATDIDEAKCFAIAAEALDRAGIFPDEAVLAEIGEAVSEIERLSRLKTFPLATELIKLWALRLATAVRKLGIGGGL